MNLTELAINAIQPGPKRADMLLNGAHLYGDSIMENSIRDKLKAKGVSIKCDAQAGDTAAGAWKRFAWDVRCMRIVVLQHGTNDITLGHDPIPYLRRMAEYAIAEGRHVIFTGLTVRELAWKYDWHKANFDILRLAAELKCHHARWDLIPYSSDDKLHPDAAMQDRMVAALYPYIL